MKKKNDLIYYSSDYSRFENHETNRDPSKHSKLTASMKEYGWLKSFPMLTVPGKGNKFKILDGGHRFSIAAELKIPICYVVESRDDISIPQINDAVKRWSVKNFVQTFAKQGNQEYAELEKFALENGIAISIAARLLNGGRSVNGSIENGEYKISNRPHAANACLVMAAARKHVKWASNYSFLHALSNVLRFSPVKADALCAKIKSHPAKLIQQPNIDGFIKMLEELYNYHSRESIPIFVSVQNATRAEVRKVQFKSKTK